MTISGTTVDLSGRKTIFGDNHPNNPVLTAEEAAEASDMKNMFGEWDPTYYTEQASAPQNVKLDSSTQTITWDNSNYVFCWAIVKNSSIVAFTTEPRYIVDDLTATYAVRAANEMGGLGEPTEAVLKDDTSIGEQPIVTTAKDDTFNLQGIRVKANKKGVYIQNGKKIVVKR